MNRLLYLFIRTELLSSHTCGNHLGLSLVIMADVEDTQSASLGLLQLLHGQLGAEHCHVAKGHVPLI
jgi:hypothetical protein